jgi:uncharacterized protein with gpF-like domain
MVRSVNAIVRESLILQSRLERSHRKQFIKLYKDFFNQAARAVEDQNIALLNAIENVHQGNVLELLERVYKDTIPVAGDFGTRSIARKTKAEFDFNADFLAIISRWINRNSLRESVLINETTVDVVRNILERGSTAGLPIDDIAKEIQKKTKSASFMATRVARTEIHNAFTFGSKEAITQASVENDFQVLKRWIPVEDMRTRPDHAVMDSHPAIPLDAKFRVGGRLMDRPGDPAGGAAQVVNCRCAVVYEED